MPIRSLLPCALLAFACLFPAAARGQDAPTPTAAPRVVAFGKPPASWKEGKSGGSVRATYKTPAPEGEAEGATVQVRTLGPKTTWERQVDFFCARYEDAAGKKLDKAAVKQESFDAGGLKVHLGEFGGTFVPGSPRKPADDGGGDKGSDKKAPDKKASQKTITCLIEGAEAPWAVAIFGSAKAVDAARDDFMKYVKSAKGADKMTDEKKSDKAEKKKGGDGEE